MRARATMAGSRHERSPRSPVPEPVAHVPARSPTGRPTRPVLHAVAVGGGDGLVGCAPGPVRRFSGARLVGCARHRGGSESSSLGCRGPTSRRDPNPSAHQTSARRDRAVRWRRRGSATSCWPRWRTSRCCARAPGMVEDDSKQYLYIDPARFMSQVVSMWNPDVSMGTVTHQYIGYLLPMGPYYALMEVLGVPTWVAQRLWTGSLLFLAGAGVLFLLRTLSPALAPSRHGIARHGDDGWRRRHGGGPRLHAVALRLAERGPPVGPPAALGGVAVDDRAHGARLAHRGVAAPGAVRSGGGAGGQHQRRGADPGRCRADRCGWCGSWSRDGCGGAAPCRRALKIAVLSAAVSLWWASGLVVEGGYGMDILRYTESIQTVARTSLASETLRGLGYWFFYGVDKLGLYLPMARSVHDVAGGCWRSASPCLPWPFWPPSSCAGASAPISSSWWWSGTVLSVGAHPLSGPSPLGSLVKAAATGSTVGLALRSTNRATPLVVLGTAVLLGAGVAALARRWKVVGADRGGGGHRTRRRRPALLCGRGSSWRPTCRGPSTSRRTGARPRPISTSRPGPTRRAWPSSRASTSPPTGGGPPSSRYSPGS